MNDWVAEIGSATVVVRCSERTQVGKWEVGLFWVVQQRASQTRRHDRHDTTRLLWVAAVSSNAHDPTDDDHSANPISKSIVGRVCKQSPIAVISVAVFLTILRLVGKTINFGF